MIRTKVESGRMAHPRQNRSAAHCPHHSHVLSTRQRENGYPNEMSSDLQHSFYRKPKDAHWASITRNETPTDRALYSISKETTRPWSVASKQHNHFNFEKTLQSPWSGVRAYLTHYVLVQLLPRDIGRARHNQRQTKLRDHESASGSKEVRLIVVLLKGEGLFDADLEPPKNLPAFDE